MALIHGALTRTILDELGKEKGKELMRSPKNVLDGDPYCELAVRTRKAKRT
jgi:hypothetical protein